MIHGSAEEFRLCVKDLLDAPCVQSMQRFTQHGDVSTLEHCLFVAFFSYLICRKFRWDFRAAARGGLLHDLFLYDWHTPHCCEGLHGFTHPRTALKNAQKYFVLTRQEENIILSHMWPLTLRALPRHRESIVVCCADKVCALLETFGYVRRLRRRESLRWILLLCRMAESQAGLSRAA